MITVVHDEDDSVVYDHDYYHDQEAGITSTYVSNEAEMDL